MFTDETTLLSSLLTDARMREALRSSSQTFITKHALNDSLSAFVLSLDLDQLDKQAECLIQKRFSEVKMLLPRTIAQLGKEAWCRFSEYATRYWPRGHRRHLLDAVQFGNYCFARSQPFDRCEWSCLQFLLGSNRFSLQWFKLDSPWHYALLIQWRYQGICYFRWFSNQAPTHPENHSP